VWVVSDSRIIQLDLSPLGSTNPRDMMLILLDLDKALQNTYKHPLRFRSDWQDDVIVSPYDLFMASKDKLSMSILKTILGPIYEEVEKGVLVPIVDRDD